MRNSINCFLLTQSAYHRRHTETVVICLKNDNLHVIDHGEVTVLVLLDLSAAFDTADQPMLLLNVLNHRFALDGIPLLKFEFYLTDRSQSFPVDGTYPSLSASVSK